MPAFLFVSIPLHGHLWPATCVAKALAARLEPGSSVTFAGLEGSRAVVEAQGLAFASLGELPPAAAAALAAAASVLDGGGAGDLRSAAATAMGPAYFSTYLSVMAPPLLRLITGDATLPTAGAAAAASSLSTTPNYDVIVADHATLAGYAAAEALALPLAVLQQMPLSYGLALSGHAAYNAPAAVPVELPGAVLPERMGLWARLVANRRLKAARLAEILAAYDAALGPARAALGLPPRAPGAAPYEIPTPAPRGAVLNGAPPELEVPRAALPPGWAMTGPQGIDDYVASFPPPLPRGGGGGGDASEASDASEARIAAFLDKAEAEGLPVVYVALGTLARLDGRGVAAMAGAFAANSGAARFVWSLPKPQQALLPDGLDTAAILVTPWAPQAALLAQPAVRLFVTHAGLNSTAEALAAGKPMLALPFFADQGINAQHIENRRLGAQMAPGKMSAASLGALVAKLLADGGLASRAAAAGACARRAGGGAAAAAALLKFAAGGGARST
ncbi:MAG: hypothetical protein J3K34DRAFT_384651 [Monoraphidium minutum]|nr:MAG: hypothetical protein J3K34DRAFT_384651 [Monoraphidium minutum]